MPRTKETVCPCCGYKIDACTHASGDETIAPSEGDVSVCFSCTEYLKYGKNLSLEKISEEELARMDSEIRGQLALIRYNIRMVKLFGPEYTPPGEETRL
jgi:hypothetical protein